MLNLWSNTGVTIKIRHEAVEEPLTLTVYYSLFIMAHSSYPPPSTPPRPLSPIHSYHKPPSTSGQRYHKPPSTSGQRYHEPSSTSGQRYHEPSSTSSQRYHEPPSTSGQMCHRRQLVNKRHENRGGESVVSPTGKAWWPGVTVPQVPPLPMSSCMVVMSSTAAVQIRDTAHCCRGRREVCNSTRYPHLHTNAPALTKYLSPSDEEQCCEYCSSYISTPQADLDQIYPIYHTHSSIYGAASDPEDTGGTKHQAVKKIRPSRTYMEDGVDLEYQSVSGVMGRRSDPTNTNDSQDEGVREETMYWVEDGGGVMCEGEWWEPVDAHYHPLPGSSSREDTASLPSLLDNNSLPSLLDNTSLPSREDTTSLPSLLDNTSLPSLLDNTSLPSREDTTSLPSRVDNTSLPSREDTTSLPSRVDTSLPSRVDTTSLPSLLDNTSLPSREDTTSLPSREDTTSLPSYVDTSLPSREDTASLPSREDTTSLPSREDTTSLPSREDTRLPSGVDNYQSSRMDTLSTAHLTKKRGKEGRVTEERVVWGRPGTTRDEEEDLGYQEGSITVSLSPDSAYISPPASHHTNTNLGAVMEGAVAGDDGCFSHLYHTRQHTSSHNNHQVEKELCQYRLLLRLHQAASTITTLIVKKLL